jgi:hypothetical protein
MAQYLKLLFYENIKIIYNIKCFSFISVFTTGKNNLAKENERNIISSDKLKKTWQNILKKHKKK